METILNRKTDTSKTIKNFKKVAGIYDFWSWLTESKAAKKVLELADIQNDTEILEVACGTGVVLEQIIRKNPNGHNTGIDLSPDMLQKARQRLQKTGYQNYKLQEGNVLDLNFRENSFHVLVNNFMVDLMPEGTFDKIASEFFRILRPNGIAVISTFSFGTKRVHKFWYRVAKNFPDMLTGCRPVSFTKYLEKAGFTILEDVQVSQNTFPSEVIKARKPA